MSYSQSEADLLKQLADRTATVEALRRERDEARDFLNTVANDLNEQAAALNAEREKVKDGETAYRKLSEKWNVTDLELMQLQALVEALRRERDEEQQRLLVVCQQRNDAMTALDAEREKVANLDAMYRQQLGDRDKRIEALAGSAKIWMKRYTQLQALVRAASERWRAQTNVKEGISFRMAMKALEATLDATTPATMGSNILEEDIGKAMMRSKGGDGESQRI